jgi:hypothetical protein
MLRVDISLALSILFIPKALQESVTSRLLEDTGK